MHRTLSVLCSALLTPLYLWSHLEPLSLCRNRKRPHTADEMLELPPDALRLIAEAALRADPSVRRWAQLRTVAKDWNHWLAGPPAGFAVLALYDWVMFSIQQQGPLRGQVARYLTCRACIASMETTCAHSLSRSCSIKLFRADERGLRGAHYGSSACR